MFIFLTLPLTIDYPRNSIVKLVEKKKNEKKKEFEILPTNLYDFDKVVLLISTTF